MQTSLHPILLALLFFSCTSTNFSQANEKELVAPLQNRNIQKSKFAEVQKKYDTLIPVMNGLFITCDSFDFATYRTYINKLLPEKSTVKDRSLAWMQIFSDGHDGFTTTTKKWGVIDSAGNTIVPFICDGVREFENGKGVFSIYKESRSLNTGLPRYNYTGYYYFFDKSGVVSPEGKLFTITTIFVADFHRAEFVIEQGNAFYLPPQYFIKSKKARGAISKKQ